MTCANGAGYKLAEAALAFIDADFPGIEHRLKTVLTVPV